LISDDVPDFSVTVQFPQFVYVKLPVTICGFANAPTEVLWNKTSHSTVKTLVTSAALVTDTKCIDVVTSPLGHASFVPVPGSTFAQLCFFSHCRTGTDESHRHQRRERGKPEHLDRFHFASPFPAVPTEMICALRPGPPGLVTNSSARIRAFSFSHVVAKTPPIRP
jgi:hypothetical protein